MLPIKAWRIYYADGSTFDSTQGTMAEAPAFGVQCRVWYHVTDDQGREFKTIDGGEKDGDVFVHEDGSLKMGLWMDTEGHYRIMDAAARSSAPEVKDTDTLR